MNTFKINDRVIVAEHLKNNPRFKDNIGTIVYITSENFICVWFDNVRKGDLHGFDFVAGYNEDRGYYFKCEHLQHTDNYCVELI